MKTGKVEQWRDDVIGLRPVYTDLGNATEVLLKDGEVVLDERGLKSVLTALGRAYAVDFKAQRMQVKELLQKQGTLPFYLGSERVFVPLKMRRAVTDNDQVYGYVDVRFMEEPYTGDNYQCLVRLKTGLELDILSSVITAAASRHTGLRLLEVLNVDSGRDSAEQQIVNSVLYFIRCLNAIHQRLQSIENRMNKQVAESGEDYK
jgi:hypothetical protein